MFVRKSVMEHLNNVVVPGQSKEGTFGRVRLAKNKNNQKFYAVKILKKSDIIKSKQIDHVQS